VRARLIWHDALQRAGRVRDAKRQLDRIARMRRIAPALIRHAIEQRLAAVAEKSDRIMVADGAVRASPRGVALVHLSHEEDDDGTAVRRVLERTVRDLGPSRVELISMDAGPVSTLISVGAGLPTRIGQRVIEAGILIRDDTGDGACETGVPVRLGSRLLAALVCRWPLDRQPPPQNVDLLTLAAAVIAPRVDAFVGGIREASNASTSVPELIGVSAAISEVRRAIARAARAPFSVMIEGSIDHEHQTAPS
jgi:hypothetical protein